jgi:hypothetical protein
MKQAEATIVKPLTVVHWKVEEPTGLIEELFSQETELRTIEDPNEVIPLLYRYKVSYLVIGAQSSEDFKKEWLPVLQKVPLTQRREVFVLLVLPSAKTFDAWQTFLHSVNLLVSVYDLKDLPFHLQRAKQYFCELYEPYFRAMRNFAEELR